MYCHNKVSPFSPPVLITSYCVRSFHGRRIFKGRVVECGSVFIFSGSGSRGWCWRPIRIRIQYGSSALMTKNWKKITAENFLYIFFLSKTAIYLSLGLHKVCPSYRRSLQFSKEAIQHFKTWTFTNHCLLLRVIFALLDPDPDSEYGSGSTDPIEYGSNPDPQPCLKALIDTYGGFIKEEYYSWVQYKSGPGGGPSMWKEYCGYLYIIIHTENSYMYLS
jgi:hypothetical protein